MTDRGAVLRAFACAGALAVAAPAPAALAQALQLGHSDQPIEILADHDIEWQREQQRYIARGHASAKQGDTTIYADVLTAYYRPQPKPAGPSSSPAPQPPHASAQNPGVQKAAATSSESKPGPKPGDPKATNGAGGTADDKEGGGSTQIYRYEAEGHVRIVTPTDTALGDKGIYDTDTGILVLTGHGLKLTTPNEVITARDSLEYWADKQMAVARGNAVAVTQDRRMTGDILTSYFVDNRTNPPPPTARNVKAGARKTTQTAEANPTGATPTGANPTGANPIGANSPGAKSEGPKSPGARPGDTKSGDEGGQGNNRLQRIEGFGHVHVSTPTEIVTADRGVYNADTGIAMMSDNVRITRGDNQLNGDFAEVNLNTGISRLLTRSEGNATAQVRGLFIPQKKQPADGTPSSDDQGSRKTPSKTSDNKTSNKKATP